MTQVLAYLAFLLALSRPPDMVGKATHYHDYFQGRLTRSEEVFAQDAFTAAVDDGMWPELRDRRLLVCGERKCIVIRVNDTGYLADYGVLVDLSKRAFRQLAPLRQGVVEVKVWVMQ